MAEAIKPMKLGIKRPVTRPLLPDPEPRKVDYTLISVDDHLMELPHTFEGRMPREYEARAPRVVETEEGHQVWSIDGTPYFQVGFMCVAGRPREDHRVEPALRLGTAAPVAHPQQRLDGALALGLAEHDHQPVDGARVVGDREAVHGRGALVHGRQQRTQPRQQVGVVVGHLGMGVERGQHG